MPGRCGACPGIVPGYARAPTRDRHRRSDRLVREIVKELATTVADLATAVAMSRR